MTGRNALGLEQSGIEHLREVRHRQEGQILLHLVIHLVQVRNIFAKWKKSPTDSPEIIPLAAMFEERLGIPTALTNDANAAAIGEMTYVRKHADQGHDRLL